MNAANQPGEGVGRPVLLAKLLAAVRPEFRAEPLTFAVDDAVFGGTACSVRCCARTARSSTGLCPGHHTRWLGAGRPEVTEFAASTDPRWQRELPNGGCRAAGCGYGVARSGVCQLHFQRWTRSGEGDLTAWLGNPLPIKAPVKGATCRISNCELWPQAQLAFCHSHANSWRGAGRGDVEAFARSFSEIALPADESIPLGQLGTQLRLEMQYALQCRHDDRTAKTSPAIVNRVVRFLIATQTSSLLDRPEDTWRAGSDHPAPRDPSARALLSFARRKVDDLAHGCGWEGEYPRPVWRLRRLGFEGNETLVFDVISQPWLVELAKRWLRWRLSTGLHPTTVRRGLGALNRFSEFCQRIGVTALNGIDRDVLERYLADLRADGHDPQRYGVYIGQLNAFLQAIRQHRWDDTLPTSALFFTADFPKRSEALPRALAEQVMTQIEDPEALARWTNPAYRLVTLILIRCGLRVTDALRLPADCLVTDADGAPYLRYDNHKMKRQALVPIDEELQALIITERANNASSSSPWLFPRPTKNLDGQLPTASSTYRLALYRWLARCEVRDAHGLPVRLTPHQWRHTLGTRLINRDVPQEVVRRILDHDSPQMTAHYARLHDSTVRRHWEAARKVDIAGHAVVMDPGGPLAEAAWAKQRLGRATQALPNGFCGLPVQKTCPHANACLTCPMFITTAEFLPQHRDHQRQVIEIITAAEARGQTRLVEMNQHVARNLDTIITALQSDIDNQDTAADAC
ncbi:MAG: tyrosine-type recombinase/integrase [Phycicoccus sp.]|nr:tyrosine-type recombinase/integrase [Phycicoccus sp.]NMM35132.1 tyrosine-type recombinase/integrase [Phycicoccus sp.]